MHITYHDAYQLLCFHPRWQFNFTNGYLRWIDRHPFTCLPLHDTPYCTFFWVNAGDDLMTLWDKSYPSLRSILQIRLLKSFNHFVRILKGARAFNSILLHINACIGYLYTILLRFFSPSFDIGIPPFHHPWVKIGVTGASIDHVTYPILTLTFGLFPCLKGLSASENTTEESFLIAIFSPHSPFLISRLKSLLCTILSDCLPTITINYLSRYIIRSIRCQVHS